MNTTLKMILAAASVTACLATPAAAANHTRSNSSTATSASGSQLGTDRAPVIDDCIHVAFPQCSGGV